MQFYIILTQFFHVQRGSTVLLLIHDGAKVQEVFTTIPTESGST